MKALVGAFNQEKALVGAFSVIVKSGCGTDGSICGTSDDPPTFLLTTARSAVAVIDWDIFIKTRPRPYAVRPPFMRSCALFMSGIGSLLRTLKTHFTHILSYLSFSLLLHDHTMDVCIFISNSQNRQERMTIKWMQATKTWASAVDTSLLYYCILVCVWCLLATRWQSGCCRLVGLCYWCWRIRLVRRDGR